MWEARVTRRRMGGAIARRTRRRVRVMAAFIAVAAGVPFVAAQSVAHAQNPGFTEYGLSSGYDRPLSIVTGPDNNLWFTELTGSNIGTITPGGTVTEYAIPSYSGFLGTGGIAAGPDSSLWFTDLSNNTVGKITTGGSITEYATLSTANAYPESIAAGPDGNLWFSEGNANFVGKVTTAGVITEYPITANASSQQIAAGADGNVWFAEQGLDRIGVITPSGTYTEIQLASGASPDGVVAGPDGNMWVAEAGTNVIDKVSTSGTVLAQYPLLTSGAAPADLTVGPANNIWFSEYGGNAIGSVTTAGVVNEYPTGESGSPLGITGGPDGNIWYTEYHGNAVGRFSLGACASLADTVSTTPLGPGSPETVSVTLASCGATPLNNAMTTTTTTAPSGCPAAPSIPSFTSTLAYGQTDPHPTTFPAPSCAGIYVVSSQTSVGSTVMATAQTSYSVLAVGDGVLYNTNETRPTYVTTGSDGNLWWTDFSSTLHQITPSGVMASFQNVLPNGASQIATGSDGSLYVVTSGPTSSDSVAQLRLNGCCAPSFVWQAPAGAGTSLGDLQPGVDGNVWFTAGSSTHGIVGFVTPASKVKRFNLPAGSGLPLSITAGPDNAMWFTLDSGQVGRITTAGAMNFFAMPASIKGVFITLGPDGNFWLTAGHHSGDGVSPNYVLRMTPSGGFTTFTTPTPDVNAGSITTGADGNLWFNEPFLFPSACQGAGGVARVTPAGVISEFAAGCNDFNDIFDIVAGPDGNIWNAAYYGNGINMTEVGWSGACTPLTASANPVTVHRGSPETIAVTIANCATTPHLMQLQAKTIPPSTCHTGSATTNRVPLGPRVETRVSESSTSQCKGTYKVKLTLSVGSQVVATTSVTYTVT